MAAHQRATRRPGRCRGREPAAGHDSAYKANQVWVGNITYLPLVGGLWCYLATWRDACSRRVVGLHLAAQMSTELVLMALD